MELLRPWRSTLRAHFTIRGTRAEGDSDDFVVVATLELPDAATSDPRVRQAMELLSLAMLLDSGLVRKLVLSQWLAVSSRFYVDVHEVHFDVAVKNALLREAPLGDVLSAIVAFTQQEEEEEDAEFKRVRDALRARIVEAGGSQELQELQVRVSCTVSATPPPRHPSYIETDTSFHQRLPTQHQAEVFLQRVECFAEHLNCLDVRYVDEATTPFTLSKVRLELGDFFPITSSVVRAVERLASNGIVFIAPTIAWDPPVIFCSSNELTAFLNAVGCAGSTCEVKAAYFPYRNRFTAIDANGEDKSEVINVIMNAMAACGKLQVASVGGLLSLLSQPSNRRHFWKALDEVLLAPIISREISAAWRPKFTIYVHAELTEEDAAAIQEITARACRARRRITRFRLITPRTSPQEAVLALVSLVRDMEAIHLVISRRTPISPAIVSGILQRSPKLRSIQLPYAVIPTLAIFSDASNSASGKCLQNIELLFPHQVTQASVTAFLNELLDPNTQLASSLRSLTLVGHGETVFQTATVELLERVLSVNRRLHSVTIKADVSYAAASAPRNHTGDFVLGNALRSIRERVAFLSVVDAVEAVSPLDLAVVRNIFDFAVPLVRKRVVCLRSR